MTNAYVVPARNNEASPEASHGKHNDPDVEVVIRRKDNFKSHDDEATELSQKLQFTDSSVGFFTKLSI